MAVDIGNDEYTCVLCRETFTKGRPDEEAIAEHEHYFGPFDPATAEIVCDKCWQKIHPERN